MIKDISRENVRYELGHLSISVDDVIRILESKGELKLTAKNGDVEFESLEDIKAHKTLFAGQPKIYTENAIISFERNWASVSPIWGSNNFSIVKSIYHDIVRHKSFVDRFAELKIFRTFYVLTIIFVYFFYNVSSEKFNIPDYISFTITFAYIAYFSALTVKHLWDGYSIFFRNAVFYEVKDSFLKRNFDTIAVSALTGVVALVIGAFVPGLIEKLKGWF
ncbi:hypothetical protein HFC70_20085 [Agrobacterium sp. a22-2]|uniref:hypothetical protein n=1 Tax=Agrobacterium sp. a22-2 TaxID=2283840 RepID=UPI001447A478|nr:hypothetical protein [Agrobacterium sp. a22-2]NKN38654.1 hypothetical protein [Agrobacterium sp. a22-2]